MLFKKTLHEVLASVSWAHPDMVHAWALRRNPVPDEAPPGASLLGGLDDLVPADALAIKEVWPYSSLTFSAFRVVVARHAYEQMFCLSTAGDLRVQGDTSIKISTTTFPFRGEQITMAMDYTGMVPLCAALLALEDPRIDAVFLAFRVMLRDEQGRTVWPKEMP